MKEIFLQNVWHYVLLLNKICKIALKIIISLHMLVNNIRQLEVGAFLNFYCNIVLLQLKITQIHALGIFFSLYLSTISTRIYPTNKEEKGHGQQWSSRSNYHQNQHFPVTPTNMQIIEITPSLQDSDSSKQLCANFLLPFYVEYMYFLHDTPIILSMALCSPLLLNFSAENGN